MKRKEMRRIGSSFDEFLGEEGILNECEAHALKELLAMQAVPLTKTDDFDPPETAKGA